MKRTLLFFLAFVCLAANAQTELLYWNDANYGTTSMPRAGVGSIPEISGTESFSGLTPLNDNRGFLLTNNMSATLDPQSAPYMKYTVTLTEALKLERFVLGGYSYFPYATKAQLRWSRDNFASSLGEFTYSTYYSVTSVALPAQTTLPAGTVEFRIYFYGAPSPTNISISQSQPGFNSNADGTPSGCIPAWGHAVSIYGRPPCRPNSSETTLALPSSALPYAWNGLSFSAAGTQTAHLTNAGGCDSAATLRLLVDAPGAALHFDGINDVATLPASTRFDLPEATVEAWVKRDALNGQNVCILGSRAFELTRFSVHMSNNAIGLWNGSSYNTVYAGTFQPGTWYHVAMVIGANNSDVYLNGALIGSTGNGMGTQTDLPFVIGAANPDGSGEEQFNGSLDEVRIWSRALAACEIAQTYASELDGPQGGLLAYYKFNQGIAGGDNRNFISVDDESGNGMNAVLENMARNGGSSNFDAPGAVASNQYTALTACNLLYPGAPFCRNSGTGMPQHLNVAGARFWAQPAGLRLDAATGAIDLAASQAGTYTVFYGNNESSGSTTVVVRPTAGLSPVPNQNVCSETYTNPVSFPVLPGLRVQWTNDNPAIGLGTSGTGDIPGFFAFNMDTATISGNIRAYATGGTGCSFKPMVFRINVKPTPQVQNWPESQDLCAGTQSAPVTFTSTLSNTTFSWYNDNSGVGLAASGTGNIPAFMVQNDYAFGQWAGVMVQPARGGCYGNPAWFSYRVAPAVQSIAFPAASYCQSGSVRPTRNGSAGGAWLTSPAGLVIDQLTGTVNLAASQPGHYSITYDLGPVNSCSTSASTTLDVKAQAGVSPVNNQVYCSGVQTAPIAFVGSGSSYVWVNDNPSIGLPASGTGNIPAFTTINNGAVPVYANIKVYPQGDGCAAKAMGFRFQVNPCGPLTTVSPNPAAGGTLRVSYSGTATQLLVEIQDGFGQIVVPAQRFSGSGTQVNISALRPGLYYVHVVDVLSGDRTRTQLVKL